MHYIIPFAIKLNGDAEFIFHQKSFPAFAAISINTCLDDHDNTVLE